jgi:hypothetical protein
MVLGLVESLADKLQPIHADYEKRLAEQERKREEAAARAGGVMPPLPPGAVDDKWRTEKCKVAAKALLKSAVVPGLDSERARNREAAGDALQALLKPLEEAEGGGGEALQWRKFELLRLWVRLGIPARPPFVR